MIRNCTLCHKKLNGVSMFFVKKSIAPSMKLFTVSVCNRKNCALISYILNLGNIRAFYRQKYIRIFKNLTLKFVILFVLVLL